MSNGRLIQPSDIPESLWNKALKCLYLPPMLVDGWKNILITQNLFIQACQPAPEGDIGGISKEDTDRHFTWRFSGSSARVQMALLDPTSNLSIVSDAFTTTLSGGRVLLVDLPCGSGAAALTILATLAELRASARIPRTPLTVVLVGGEISTFARDNAIAGINALKTTLEDQAIWLEYHFFDWDVCDKYSNADLIKKLTVIGDTCDARLLILANFSGFLQNNGHWKNAKTQFDDLFLHSRDHKSVAIWIEPDMNSVTKQGGFFPKIINWFRDQFPALLPVSSDISKGEKYFATADAPVQHPFRPDHKFKSNLAVVRFDLPLKKPSI